MAADLHIHTTYSDGTFTPEQIVKVAQKVSLKTVAITDHDTTAGIAEALQAGPKYEVEIIPGIEFTTETEDLEIHVLGYFIDYRDEKLQKMLDCLKAARRERIYKIVEKLKGVGVKIKAREIFRLAKNDCPGRPHVAQVLMHEGVCKNFREAFAKYLAFGGPAYVSHYKLLPEEAVKLIGEVGGIAVLAHPGGLNREANLAKLNALLPPLVAAGLAGVEAYYPTHSSEQVNYYLGLAAEWGLLVTGGSDFHGESSVREVVFGEFALADEYVDKLKQKIRERV